MDGPTKDIHERTRGDGTFNKVVTAMKRLAERNIDFRASMTTTPENIWYLEETCEFARNIGASFFGYNPVSPFGKGWEQAWSWNPEDLLRIAEIEKKVLEKYKGFIGVLDKNQQDTLSHSNCGVGHKNAVLSPSGKVTFCLMADRRTYLGDLTEQTVEEVFSNPVVPFLRNLPVPSPMDCSGCRYEHICRNCVLRPLVVMQREGRICRWGKRYRVADFMSLPDEVKFNRSSRNGEVFLWDSLPS